MGGQDGRPVPAHVLAPRGIVSRASRRRRGLDARICSWTNRGGGVAAAPRQHRGGVAAGWSDIPRGDRRGARVRYAWCGVWTSIYLAVLASFNASGLIRYCTRFTEDVFNALLAFNFVAEGASPLWRGLQPALATGRKSADALLALNAALGTSVACRAFAGAPRSPRPARTKPTARRLGDARSLVKPTARCLRETRALGAAGAFPDEISATVRGARSRRNVDRPDAGRVFSAKARALLADFGPAAVVVSASAVLSRPAARRLGGLERLKLGAPREQIFSAVDLGALRVKYRILAMVPAVFLATLFFLDQNITVRTVNSPQNKLKKGAAYHLDLAALAFITLGSSLLGLPWMCSATVQSLNHVRALSTYVSRRGRIPSRRESRRTPARLRRGYSVETRGRGGRARPSTRGRSSVETLRYAESVETAPPRPALDDAPPPPLKKPAPPLAAPAGQKRPLPAPDEIIRAAKLRAAPPKQVPKATVSVAAPKVPLVKAAPVADAPRGVAAASPDVASRNAVSELVEAPVRAAGNATNATRLRATAGGRSARRIPRIAPKFRRGVRTRRRSLESACRNPLEGNTTEQSRRRRGCRAGSSVDGLRRRRGVTRG